MIRVEFDPDNHPEKLNPEQLKWWNAWKKRAEEATNEVLEAWEEWRKDPANEAYKKIFELQKIKSVWGDLKDWLLKNVFHDKCAYCETPVIRSDFHAEHYRPKGRVTWKGKKAKITNEKGEEIDHPGYFWLAFHWKNLLPSCGWCNTGNGKKSQFPIPSKRSYVSVMKELSKPELEQLQERIIESRTWQNVFYLQPVDLDQAEGRILLHPYLDDPRKYLRFDDFGNVIEIGNEEERLRGKWSIEVYNLWDGRIVAERRKAQTEGEKRFNIAYAFYRDQNFSIDEAKQKAKEAVVGYIVGIEPYSAAVVDVLKATNPNYF